MEKIKTIFEENSNEIIIKKSRFISYVKPVICEEEALEFIEQIKTMNWNATHNVYSYVINDNNIERYSDDGEPKGTAGLPTIQTIKDVGVSNIVVVTTRYFGGVMLGAGGLIRAYRKSALEAINSSKIVLNLNQVEVEICTEYTYLSKIQSMSHLEGFLISDIISTPRLLIIRKMQTNKIE